MTAFLNEQFPLAVAFGAMGGPERRTDIVPLATGYEARNARWADSRRRYDAATGIRSLQDLRAVMVLFEKARGRLSGFRYRDPLDHTASVSGTPPLPDDQAVGTGDGGTTRFRLQKTYGAGGQAYSRAIRLPVAPSVRAAVGGVERTLNTDFQVDPATGELVFSSAPPAGVTVTAGYLFDVPVRFDTDRLEVSLTHFKAGDIPSIPLVEIRLD
ncbi:glycoside hydrolase family 24 [Roseibium aquae]|uniref:Glycoside hydrolase family 24 n=1 Tax=Roseibium aquae TaxID=1323746 RepID=A0A916TK38_9HYPH|nr:DUF2460 domain-containing protein [Roseibium aquae]GGB51019.1 glycoside hydrolase family 24 [Roseibium aquae]